jgi:hypothetical protein
MGDYIEGEVMIDYDSNTFTIERDGKVHAYDIDDEAEWLSNIVENMSNADVYVLNEDQEYEVYGQ